LRTQGFLGWKRKSLKEKEMIIYPTRPRGDRTQIKELILKQGRLTLYINQQALNELLAEDTGCQPRADKMAFWRDVVQESKWITGLDHYLWDTV